MLVKLESNLYVYVAAFADATPKKEISVVARMDNSHFL